MNVGEYSGQSRLGLRWHHPGAACCLAGTLEHRLRTLRRRGVARFVLQLGGNVQRKTGDVALVRILLRQSAGRSASPPNPRQACCMCRVLNVAIVFAWPLIAVSTTSSSSVSAPLGCQRQSNTTGTHDPAISSGTSITSCSVIPASARCFDRVKTASYSSSIGTDSSNSWRRSSASRKSWREAPALLWNGMPRPSRRCRARA